jgi:hypothetical protein
MEIYMKTTIKLAVASALVAAATSANAGIIIPAGDWTLDIGGNVNAFYSYNSFESSPNSAATARGALVGAEMQLVKTIKLLSLQVCCLHS